MNPLTSALQPGRATRSRHAASGTRSVPVPAVLTQVLETLADAKAEDIVPIDITGKSPLSDHMVIASGRSDRHVGAIADRLVTALKDHGFGVPRIEGLPHCDWVLVDTGDVVVHIFRPEVRSFYNLEKMWQVDAISGPPLS
ncbi:MAG: ribosome silencing factor [Bauldia sp.]|nr:ribosome silencing factor [Bauldia sp.]